MPQPRNLANEYRQTLNAQHFNAPLQFQDEATFQPLYQNLNLQNIDWLLNGSPEQNYTTYGWQQPVYFTRGEGRSGGGIGSAPGLGSLPPGPFGGIPGQRLSDLGGGGAGRYIPEPVDTVDPVSGALGLGGLFGGDDKPNRRLVTPGRYVPTGTATRGAQRGLLAMYEQDILPSQARQATFQRQSDINDVLNLGPEARQAIAAANPEIAALLAQLESQAGSELGMGAGLDPSQQRNVSQAIRGRQAGTLMSNGNAGAYNEALQTSQFGEQLRDKRRGFASSVIGLDQSVYGDVFDRILNRSSGTAGLSTLGQAGAVAGSSGPTQFNPESAYAGDLYNTNFNAAIAQAISAANNRTALIGAGIGAVGSLAGGAMAMCWLAREVFGVDNPRWQQFRAWMLTEAPVTLRDAYVRNGERAARWLRDKPDVKAAVRRWMDRILARAFASLR